MASVFDNGPVTLDSPETMFRVLYELTKNGAAQWRGELKVWESTTRIPVKGISEPQEGTIWFLEINDDKGNTVTAVQNSVIVLTYGRLLVLNSNELEGS